MGVEAKMIEAQNRYELALAYLQFLTNDNTITDVKNFQSIDVSTQQQTEPYKNRDDYKWMQYNVKTMKKKIDFDNSDAYPMIGAQVEYGYNDDKFTVSDISDHDYYLGAVGLSYNIFSGGTIKAKKEKAKLEYQKTQHYLHYMEDGIKLEVAKNILTLEAKRKILAQKEKALSLSDEVLVQATEMYKNQLINMSNLLMQQANQQKASAEKILAKYEETIAAAKLKLSLGQSLKQ